MVTKKRKSTWAGHPPREVAPWAYQGWIGTDGRYGFLELNLFWDVTVDNEYQEGEGIGGGSDTVQLKWQSGGEVMDANPQRWYGFRVEFSIKSPEFLALASRKLKQLFKALEERQQESGIGWTDPAQVVSVLDYELKAEELWHDNRFSKYLPLEWLLGEQWQEWKDDWKAVPEYADCTVSAIVDSPDKAQGAVEAAFVKAINRNGILDKQVANRYVQWVSRGKPVIATASLFSFRPFEMPLSLNQRLNHWADGDWKGNFAKPYRDAEMKVA